MKFGLSACGYVASVPGVDHIDVVLKTLFSLEPLVANEAEVLLDADVKPTKMVKVWSLSPFHLFAFSQLGVPLDRVN